MAVVEKLSDIKADGEAKYRALVLSLAQGGSADAGEIKEILVLSGRSMGDMERHVQVATERYRLAVVEPAERERRREEFAHQYGDARPQLEATVRQLQEEIAERRRKLDNAQGELQDIRRRETEMSQRHGSEGRQARNELARTRDPQMLRDLESLDNELGSLQNEQRRDFDYLQKHPATDDARQAQSLAYQAEEFRAAGRAVPQGISRDQAAIKQRLAGLAQVKQRMQQRQRRMEELEVRKGEILAQQWDWRLMDWRTPQEIERDKAARGHQSTVGPDPYGPIVIL